MMKRVELAFVWLMLSPVFLLLQAQVRTTQTFEKDWKFTRHRQRVF